MIFVKLAGNNKHSGGRRQGSMLDRIGRKFVDYHGRAGRQFGEAASDRKQIRHPVIHLTCQQFVAIFDLPCAGYVEKDAERGAIDYSGLCLLTASQGQPTAAHTNAAVRPIAPMEAANFRNIGIKPCFSRWANMINLPTAPQHG